VLDGSTITTTTTIEIDLDGNGTDDILEVSQSATISITGNTLTIQPDCNSFTYKAANEEINISAEVVTEIDGTVAESKTECETDGTTTFQKKTE